MKALVLASGGVDSTTCLGLAVNKYGKENVIALTVAYGQKHTKEIEAARKTAEYYGVEHLYLDLEPIFRYSDCSLLKHSDREIPHESYAEQLKETDGSPVSTYVPFRNGLFLSSAASIALSKNCSVIYYGAHADDAAGNAYPDCSSAFHNAINEAIYQGSGGQLKVEAPFVSCTKAEVVKTGLELNVPYELTWSCYEGGEKPCGVCGTCIDRAEAFRLNGVKDRHLTDRSDQKYPFDHRKEKNMSRENLEKEGITLLGNQKVKYPDNYAPEVLETFLNKHPDNDYFVKFNCPEFTSLCPITGQPDFATITISYVPGEKMVESKSLKLYLFSFRNHGDFHEDCVNIIMKDLIRLMDPKYIEVWGKFTPRGGISIDPYCNYGKAGTRWEEIAWKRLAEHDMYPEKIDNR